jgi:peptide/nickel transport system permease protein
VRRLAPALILAASFGLVLLVAFGVFSLAAQHYAPSSASTTGSSASAITGWSILAPGQPRPIATPLDLAHQAGTDRFTLIAAAAANSAVLLVLACALALGIGIPFGFWIGISGPRVLAALVRATTSVGVTFPAFFLAFLLQLVAIALAERAQRTVVPVYGYGLDLHMVLPTLALTLAPLAYATRLVALAAEDVERREFVRTARAKGMTERIVVYRHVAANMVGAIGESALGALRLALGGLVIVEFLLVWPGLGLLILRAANVQDVPVFFGGVAVLAVAFLTVELALDAITQRAGRTAG